MVAENKGQSLADNLATPSPGSEGQTPAEGTTGPLPAPEAQEKFASKSREEIVQSYDSLQQKYAQQTTELGQIREWFQQIMPYFKLEKDAQTGQDNLVLNQEVIKALGQSYGWFPPQKTDNEPNQPPAVRNGNAPDLPFEGNELKSIVEMIRNEVRGELGKFRDEAVTPIQQQVQAARNQAWIENVSKKYPDFDAYRRSIGELMNRGLQINSSQELEEAYFMAKARSGGMVDKKQTEAHMTELNKLLQLISPGAGQPRVPVEEMTNEQLFGLKAPDTPQQRAFEQLTGVRSYREG